MGTRRPTAPRSERRPGGGAGRGAPPRSRAGAGRGPGTPRGGASPRPSTRPAPAARGRTGASASGADRRRARGPRVLVVAALALVLAIFLVPSVQKWLEQRSEIGRLSARIEQQREDLALARAAQQRWATDEYVRTQARTRLDYVLPGEVPYVVDGGDDADEVAPAQAAASATRSSVAWYENVWDSLRTAGTPDGTEGAQLGENLGKDATTPTTTTSTTSTTTGDQR